MGQVDAETLMPLQAWCVYRQAQQRQLQAHCRARSVRLGPHWQLQFEDELTVRLQLQQSLQRRASGPARPGRPGAASQEAPHPSHWAERVPDGSEWTASLYLSAALPADPGARQALLALLDEALPLLYVEVARQPRSHARRQPLPLAPPGGPAPPPLLRFALNASSREAVLAQAPVRLGCEHPHYHWRRQMPTHALERLRRDLVLPGRVAPSPPWPPRAAPGAV